MLQPLLAGCSSESEPPDRPAELAPFQLRSDVVVLEFGGQPADPEAAPTLLPQLFIFDGEFESAGPSSLSGSASVQMPDGRTASVTAAGGQISVQVAELTMVLDPLADAVQVDGEELPLQSLVDQFASEISVQGVAALSDRSAALAVYSAFWGTRGIQPNLVAARELDYGWWCEAWATAGAVAMVALTAIGCALLLAGCVGTVVIGPLGAVSCVTASVLCSLLGTGLTALVAGIAELLWGDP